MNFLRTILVAMAMVVAFPAAISAQTSEAMNSVVSVLPVWPGQAQGGAGAPPGVAPEGSGVVVANGVVATAWHVIEPARRIDVRLHDGRILETELLAHDAASDIALLRVDADLSPLELAPEPELAAPVCGIGNAFGLGLSVTCGVVSATQVTNAGFNRVEDFVQTDTAINPGASGGALVDPDGRLVGMLSAIFASNGDTNTGVGFAVSAQLLERVVEALLDDGEVAYPAPGWRLGRTPRSVADRIAAPLVRSVTSEGPAEIAGVQAGDLVVEIGSRRVRSPRDAVAALAVLREDTEALDVVIERNGELKRLTLSLRPVRAASGATVSPKPADCPHPQPVCVMRQAVFPITSFDPAASATRIGPNLLVTNRHVVADAATAIVHTPSGPLEARVLPSAYLGDLAILEVEGLPENSHVPEIEASAALSGPFYAIGADIARQEIRVFEPGGIIAAPDQDADLGRLHVTAYMQPGVSGGALVNESGALVGINVGGGEGRFEAIPVDDVLDVLGLQDDELAADMTERLGTAIAECTGLVDAIQPRDATPDDLSELADTCSATMNHGQLLEAGRVLAMAGDFDGAIALHGQAARQVPNSINARVSLLVSLQLAARFDDMTAHARRVMELAPNDPQILRFAIQSGVWGGEPELAEEAYEKLRTADPLQAGAARRFIDSAPPAPERR